MISKIAIIVLGLTITNYSSAQTFYKCDRYGMTVFSQQPCGDSAEEIKAKNHPSQYKAKKNKHRENANVISKNPQADITKVKIYSIEQKIKRHNSKINSAKRKMSKEISTLKARTAYASNNLAGAIYQDALSEEMIAISNKYTAIINDEDRLINALKEQKKQFQYELTQLQ